MRRALILLLISISSLSTKAQSIDSLKHIWQNTSQPDSNRLKAIAIFTWNGYLFSNPDSAFYYAQLQYKFAESKGLKKFMAGANNIQGISLAVRGDYPQALNYFEKAQKIQNEIGDLEGLAKSITNIGSVYRNQGNLPKALEYGLKGMALEEKRGDKKGIAASMNGLGTIYEEQNNYEKALEYYLKSKAICEELGERQGLGIAYSNIGTIYSKQGNYAKALEYHYKSLTTRDSSVDRPGYGIALYNIGNIYHKLGNNVKALEFYGKSLAVHEELDDDHGITSSLSGMGGIYCDEGNYAKSLDYCQRALDLAQKMEVLDEQQNACNCLYKTYKALGNGNKALEFYEKMTALKDSIYNEENTKKLTRLEMQYDFDKKEAAALAEQEKKDTVAKQELRRQKLARNAFFVGFAVMLVFAGIFFRQRNKINLEKQRSDNLLLNILPADIAAELKEKGHADARDFDLVSILFTDFKSFTEQSVNLSAAVLVNEINVCFEAFDHIIEKYSIEKIKTIGDSYMAAGGLPVPYDQSVKNTVLAALEMQSFITQRKSMNNNPEYPTFEMRVGIHTGPVVAGIVGVKKFQYDIWGDTVNTASRMESNGEVGKVNVSQATYDLLKSDPSFIFESRGKIAAKGKGEIEMYFVSVRA